MLDFFKKIAALLFLITVALWCSLVMYELFHTAESIGIEPVMRVSGYLNNTSSFVLFGFFVPSIPMALIYVTTGIQLPRFTLRLMLLGAIIFAVIGHYVDTSFRGKMKTSNYIECTSERELALRYSSRMYVLAPSLCEESE